MPRKAHHSSSLAFEQTNELESEIEKILAPPRPHITGHLSCTGEGKPYPEPDGTMNGFQSVWQRRQRKVSK